MYLILPRAQLCAYEEHTRELLWKEPIRTNDGFDPVEVAGGGKNFARLKIQEILFFLRWMEEILHHLHNNTFANA